MSEIEFRDPTPTGGRGNAGVWLTKLEPLMEYPGRWAVVLHTDKRSKAAAAVGALRRGHYNIPPGRWTFAARKNGDGGEVFARYEGPEE